MALQKVVNIDPAIGVPGSQAAFLGEEPIGEIENGFTESCQY